MWRWSRLWQQCFSWIWVFSTYVEVILNSFSFNDWIASILHVCGGDPSIACFNQLWIVYSPRMWRWSRTLKPIVTDYGVFSTYVEVILKGEITWQIQLCILHVCGGDPVTIIFCMTNFMYSPRMWRWSSIPKILPTLCMVFSTYVEVIPVYESCQWAITSILHVCGGDPGSAAGLRILNWYSPRMWRWSCWIVV